MDNVFGLDIGTRNVVGTVGYRTDDDFVVVAQYVKEHETRAMLDGQIHDIGRVARTIGVVKKELEEQIGQPLEEVCIAAAGRVLKTVTTHIEYQYAEETIVTGEDIHTLHLLGIEKAQDELKAVNDTNYKFYCVGYTTIRYYLNGDAFISLEDHKASVIGEDIIVTFLPEDVVDGLYAAVGQVGLSVANMTLEPIAAINVAIPENFRMLNIALVDVGAGTSDISITRDGSIVAYGMIPYAGDELTEVIVQHYLVDFKTAEEMKVASTTMDEVTFNDIMSIPHTVPSEEIWELVLPTVEKITADVASKIVELNGDKSVSACFVVGGGGKIHNFTECLAKNLDLPKERVALRGEEVLKEVTFQQEDIKKDPLLVTPIGICLNYYEQKNNFIMVRFNGERMKLYDNNRLTVVDAALQAGFPNDQLFPKRGVPINFTVNGATRIARGEAGEAAIITLNDKPANINTPLEPNCDIVISPSTQGQAAKYTIEQLEEFTDDTIVFEINGQLVRCPRFVQVNGCLESPDYEIKEGDVIETRNFYTVSQIAEFMDITIDKEQEILVNNVPALPETICYENFTIDWTQRDYDTVFTSHKSFSLEAQNKAKDDIKDEKLTGEVSDDVVEDENPDEISEISEEEANASEIAETEAEPVNVITVTVNGEKVELSGKESYVFVDIFDRITFDLQSGGGRAIVTLINGRNAQFAEEIKEGDNIELYWKEN
ncbi:MAG: cell division FtsA domain-containing protein [Agathobacter sp.]|nr:cell division FtsA domain-containing protein [Agathobacter sp.]